MLAEKPYRYTEIMPGDTARTVGGVVYKTYEKLRGTILVVEEQDEAIHGRRLDMVTHFLLRDSKTGTTGWRYESQLVPWTRELIIEKTNKVEDEISS